jgi:hypothetical protein
MQEEKSSSKNLQNGNFKMKSIFLTYQEVLNGAELENLPLSEYTRDKIRKFRPFETLTGALYSDVAQNAGLKKTTVIGLSKVYMAHKNNKTMIRKNGAYIIVSNVEDTQ